MKSAKLQTSDLLHPKAKDWMRWPMCSVTWLACLFLVGCEKSSQPSISVDAPVSIDEHVLQILDPYNPAYKLDGRGRIIDLRREGAHVPASVLDEVCKLTDLSEGLSLWGADITDDSLANLQSLKKLRGLGLGNTPITPKGLVYLQKLDSLLDLWLSRNRFTDPDVEDLRQKCP